MTKRATIEALAEWLAARDDIVLLGHVSPDGDAVGACLGLWHALRAMGKRAAVCLPGGVPGLYDWLSGARDALDPGDALPFAPKAALAVDVSDRGRLGEDGQRRFDACADTAVLDHHHTNAGFGRLCVLDAQAAAVGEMAVALIDAMGIALSREMAECLFVAISTDCGQFSYSNTRPQTLCAAARCVGAGIDIAAITETLYRTRSAGRTKLLGLVLSGLELSPDGRLCWARLTEAMLREAGANREDKEGVVNYLQEIDGVRVAVLAEQRGETTKFSLRGSEPFDVARDIAVPLGGGGHSCAAGVTVEMPLEPALETVLEMARKAIEGN